MNENQTNTVAKATPKTATIETLLRGDAFKQQVAMVLPKHLTPERFCRIALTAITRTPKLTQCDQHSFFQALLSLSQFGLEPDGRRAHLIPFENRKRNVTECQLIIDYKGLVELVMRSGQVSMIHADVVRSGDDFEWDRGEVKRHKVDFNGVRGSVFAAYALVKFKDGTEKSDCMSLDEIEAIRARSRAGQSGPWVTDWNEMAKKTVFRRLSKWLTLSPEIRDAVEVDDEAIDNKRFEIAKPVFDTPSPQLFSTPENDPNPTPEPEPVKDKPKEPPQAPGTPSNNQAALQALVINAGYTFDDFMSMGAALGIFGSDVGWDSFALVPESVCVLSLKNQTSTVDAIKRNKALQTEPVWPAAQK